MAVDIEVTTAPGFEFPNAARESDRIIAIAHGRLHGIHHRAVGGGDVRGRPAPGMRRLIRERDPDVLEGHNIFRFDLEYMEARARRHRVPLRGGATAPRCRGYPSRMQVAERDHRLPPLCAWKAATSWTRGSSPSSTTWARVISSPTASRTSRVTSGWPRPTGPTSRPRTSRASSARIPATLMAYARDDVIETLALSAILSPPYFVQAQALPVRLPDRRCCAATRPRSTRSSSGSTCTSGRAVPAPGRGGASRAATPRCSSQGVAQRCPARRRDLALSLAHARPAASLPAGDSLGVFRIPAPRPPRVPRRRQARSRARRSRRAIARCPARSSRPSRSSSTPSTATSPSRRDTGTTSTRPTG